MRPPQHFSVLRLAVTLAGVAAAAALLWFVGPLVTVAGNTPLAGERERWLAIAALVVLAVAQAAWSAAQAARRNRQLLEGMIAADATVLVQRQGSSPQVPKAEAAKMLTPGEQEVVVLGERFERAVGLLKRRRVGGRHPWLAALAGRPYVYELPWYIIIGAPGAGKTTALANSGLEFPLAAELGKKVLRGIGGTRNCDWWFASEAVLIDTAGRYTTHDSHGEADRTAWLGFLKLLGQYRPGQPINGVLLTVSASDLLNATPEERQNHARALRDRIEELHAHLGMRFPIYVLITKTDLLAGFQEFFADFDKEERAQVWGVSFPYASELGADDPLARLAGDFAALEKRLYECLVERLHGEHDRDRRPAIYAFPQQWRVLHEMLPGFLQTVFADTAEGERPLLRGVYFTSATQEGTPIDRAIGGLARRLGLTGRIITPTRGTARAYFVTRLLRDVVLAESGLAGTNLHWQRHRAWMGWGLAGATAFVVVAAAALAWYVYQDNRTRLAAVGPRVASLGRDVELAKNSTPTNLVALLPTLDSLHALETSPRLQAAGARPAWLLTGGLDYGEMLDSAAGDAYRRLLKDAFVPRIAARLEERLRAGKPEQVTRTYEELKAYLMLFGGRNFDAAALRSFLSADWEATLPAEVSSEQRDALRRHLDRLLQSGEVGAPSQADPQVVISARRLVAGVPLPQRAYSRLQQAGIGAEVPDFTVESAGGPNARRVFVRASGQPLSRGVPGLYSRSVLQHSLRPRTQDVLRQLAGEQSWVLGQPVRGPVDPVLLEPLVDEVQRMYLADYTRRWSDFVADLRLIPAPDLTVSVETAQVLAHADSPLTAVLRGVVREVSVAPPRAASARQQAAGAELVDPRFEPLRRYVAGQPSPMDDMQALLGRLSTHLAAVDDAARRKTLPATGDVSRELAEAAQRAPQPFDGMLAQLAQRSAGQAFAALREPLEKRLLSEVAAPCTAILSGRYPHARAGSQEMSREDFARLFGSGGVIDGFFQRHLAPYVDTAARPWAFLRPDGSRGESGESLQQIVRAQAVRDSYFRDGGRTLGTRLEWRLLELDAGAGQFLLDIDGQVMRFGRGQGAMQALQWPGPARGEGAARVQLQVMPTSGAGHVFAGPWGLLRLIERVRVEPGSAPDRAVLLFDVEGRKARFEVRSPNGPNPLLRRELEQFQCPKRL